MKNWILPLTTSLILTALSQSVFAQPAPESLRILKAELFECLSKAEVNTEATKCNLQTQMKADRAINALAARIEANFTLTDRTAKDLSRHRALVAKELADFRAYRESATRLSAVLDAGTPAAIALFSSNASVQLTLNELDRLESQ